MWRHLTVALAVACASPALAATVTIDVRGPDGRPVTDAIVTIDAPGVAPPRATGSYAVEQRDIAFKPAMLIVPLGASVSFPNRDRVRHHVYSFSKPKRFELKLYGRDEAHSVVFDQPGLVALGCNIHDSMTGRVFVTTTPFAVAVGANGRAVLTGVPTGRVTVRVWHSSIRAPGNAMAQPLAVTGATAAAVIALRR